MKLSSKTYFEVQVDLTGTYQKGIPERGPSYSSGGEPEEPATMEDLEITRFAALKHLGARNFIPIDLLEGIDPKSEFYQKFLENVLKFLGSEAEEALLGELPEDE